MRGFINLLSLYEKPCHVRWENIRYSICSYFQWMPLPLGADRYHRSLRLLGNVCDSVTL